MLYGNINFIYSKFVICLNLGFNKLLPYLPQLFSIQKFQTFEQLITNYRPKKKILAKKRDKIYLICKILDRSLQVLILNKV